MSANALYADQFKRNDEVFRNTMEAIFQKYSSLSDPGIDVCLKTMTCKTERGSVPIDSVEGERELEALKTRVKADYSMREFEDKENEQLDMSGVTEDDANGSGEKENSAYLWQSGESFQFSMNLNNTSADALWDKPFQPEEEDEELEKTLSSHGSTLLDVYPSMLNQIGEAYRRQHVTDAARAVVRKYRRNHGQAFKTSTLNKTTDTSFTDHSLVQRNISKCFKGSNQLQIYLKDKPKPSPLKNPSYEASACFYSPRGNRTDISGVNDLTRKPEQNTTRVIDFSTPPFSESPTFSEQTPNLNQTYDVGLTSYSVQTLSVLNSPRWTRADLPDQEEMSIISQPSFLVKDDCFKDHLHSPVSSPHHGLISTVFPSSSGRSSFRPRVLNMERQMNSTASPKQRSPAHHQSRCEALHSYASNQLPMRSPRRSIYDQTNPSLSKEERQFTPSKRQRSLSGPQSTYSIHESQIDAEFRKLYHHFICRGTSSPCPSSHCHLCERHMKETSRSPSFTSSSMSALALTPLRAKHKKRCRQPEVEESLRFKRFRESHSPLKHLQMTNRFMTSAVSEPIEEQHTWDRGVLLQCPSPWLLRGTGNLRRIREARLSMQMNLSALRDAQRIAQSGFQKLEAVSPMREFHQGIIPSSQSLSRRRLQYGFLQ